MNPHEKQETVIEAITAGLLVIIFGLFLLSNITDTTAMLVGGLVLLGSGVYQSRRGWHVSLTTWVLGLVLFFGGLGLRLFLVGVLRINWVAIALLLIGAMIIWQNFRRR